MSVGSERELVQEIERLQAELGHREQESADKERQLERYAADLRETFKQERARAQELRESVLCEVGEVLRRYESGGTNRLAPKTEHGRGRNGKSKNSPQPTCLAKRFFFVAMESKFPQRFPNAASSA